jgi:hypothetical protein
VNRDELLSLPSTVDVPTAARACDIGRTLAYQLVKAGRFPAKVLRLGSRYRVVTGGPDGLLAALGVEATTDTRHRTVTTSPPNLRPVAGL